ncbi:hypothetical protein HPB51_026880 [Rhipicephalus microplus]|uniref:Uncharacterized protein n=1 Tax=Rhipicephalus microplus TaxID=6941 RepID=A0A9J6D1W0_RHIMP|nr:hypothetical protein HPB51_026880 [Rhipicephalus microplus]
MKHVAFRAGVRRALPMDGGHAERQTIERSRFANVASLCPACARIYATLDVIKVWVNSRRNIVAADVFTREYLEKLLGVTELCGIPVSARSPADRRYSRGYLHSVEGDKAKRKREAPKCRTALSPVVSAEAAVEMPSEPSSPAKDWYRSKAEESAQEVLQLKKKVKTLQQSKRRLSKRCDASENLIKELKERKLLSEKGLEVFEATFSPEIQQLLVRAHEKTNKMYPPELRAFALTLHYYSVAAYEYVRSKFNNALPSQRTLREWYKSVNGDTGFTSEAFDFIKNLAKSQDKPLIAAVMMDDMAIKKHVQLVGKKVVGYIDLGTGISDAATLWRKGFVPYRFNVRT